MGLRESNPGDQPWRQLKVLAFKRADPDISVRHSRQCHFATYSSGRSLSVLNTPPHAITSSAIKCTALSCCSRGLKVVKFSKSVNIERATCARTSAILISPITSRKFSTARTPPAPPYPTNPAALLFHSWKRKSIAFFNAADVAWLYSGVTKMKASSEAIFALQVFVCGLLY